MKKILAFTAFLLFSFQLFAQAPQRLSYQAVIRNSNNVLVVNAPIKIRLSVLQGSVNGTSVYAELHSTNTNASGVAFVEIGGGTLISGNFANINWGQGTYFLRSETDPANGTNYTIVGTTQLVSVPYSLYSNRSAQADNGLPATTNYGQLQLYNCNGRFQYTPCVPRITTNPIDSITLSTAISGGNISSDGGAAVTARGIVWGTVTAPTISFPTRTSNGIGTGSFRSNISGLNPNTLYYVRAYATNNAGTSYGNEISFRTPVVGRIPVLTTTTASAITSSAATSGGNVTDSGTARVTARGIVWSTSPNPTIALTTKTANGTGIGVFTSSLTGLAGNTLYYVRAYATNSVGTAYGNEISFRTLVPGRIPVLTTTAASAITSSTATSGGNVTDSGTARVTARGIVWSTSPNPTIALTTKTANGTGIGVFTSSLTGLAANTLYYVRAYATNSVGTAYGNEITFTSAQATTNPNILRIPVVFHVLTDNATNVSNISDCIIENQVRVLNNTFRNRVGQPNTSPEGTDVEIEFYLAKLDPNGIATNGINRVITPNCNYTTLNSTTQINAITTAAKWPINRYLNIWVLKTMPNSNNVRGQAWTTTFINDLSQHIGVFVHYSYVGSKNSGCPNLTYLDITGYKAYDLGMTLVHEVGHYLDLLHTYGTCGTNIDGCDDTPSVSGLPNALCGTNNDTKGLCAGVTKRQWQNFLDYTDDACMNRFTPCQRNKMRQRLNASGFSNIISSTNFQNTGGNLATIP